MGGVLLIVGAIVLGAFSYLTAEQGKVWNMLLMGGPTLVAGILFLACWRRSEGPALPVPPVPSAAEGSTAEGSTAEGSAAEGPALSKVEGPVPSAAEGRQT